MELQLHQEKNTIYRPTKEEIARILVQHQKEYISNNILKTAAVLIPLFKKDDEFNVLLMKRTDEVQYHKGQISFPGGRRDAEDATLQDTALREAYEEIGLQRQDAEIIGDLDDCVTATSGFLVSPFVAVIPYPYHFRISKREVKELLDVPLSVFSSSRIILKNDPCRTAFTMAAIFSSPIRIMLSGALLRGL